VEKILVKEKEYNILFVVYCLVKNLTRKTQWNKTMVKEKKSAEHLFPPANIH